MTEEFQQASDLTDDAEDRRPDPSHDEPRSLLRISPTNEAANCETVAECRAKIEAELERDHPRDWVIGLLNERIAELET